ncbi:origin recognition complex subunit 3 [Toxorhynchites rutilus septentrionalis]|uniref:origin recognition complex subunit 3 n=1 Tax=Toxorhynchites rutilus septentrionalis TaxID=329112 RepID=UPI00247A30C2|nr:origin recognition complex subunit 3 [Toxorhynchites rutilus septentrionalis]
MDPTISVSKGIFVFKNGATKAKSRRKPQKCQNLLDKATTSAFWYRNYNKLWSQIRNHLDKLQTSSYEKIMDNLLGFVGGCYQSFEYSGVLPTAALLTGINQIDHLSQFETLADNIRNNTFSLVVLVQSRDCPSVKVAIETIVSGFVEEQRASDDGESKRLKRNQLNLRVLRSWYHEKHQHLDRKPNLCVIMPDFEVFSPDVLQDLILILNSYAEDLPFVLIFGIATSIGTVHSVLPYHVTSKIKLSIFQSEPSIVNLNKILDNVFLTPYCPFHLSGNMFELLVDIFLFYDFSVKGFIEGFKYALMEHYFQGAIYALCSVANDREELEEAVEQLSAVDVESIRQLLSFRPLIESLDNPQEVVDFLTKDDYLRRMLPSMLIEVHNFWFTFHCSLEMLQALVQDLPKNPLGKQLRELYAYCISTDVTQTSDYKECMQLVAFMSKEEILSKLMNVLEVILKYTEWNDEASIRGETIFEVEPLEQMNNDLENLASQIAQAGMEFISENASEMNLGSIVSPNMGRQELKQKLLCAARQPKMESAFTKCVQSLVSYLTNNVFRKYLRPLSCGPPLIELFVFNDAATVRRHIVGVPRAAVHTALNNPHYYLQCECCELDDDRSLVPTLPDLSVAYKLHLECGRMINLFDWLQAFRTVVDESNAEDSKLDPKIQARFTRAVAELQFLGFIKTSKKKTDHVTRLTW